MTANRTESLSRNLRNFPKVRAAFPLVGAEGTFCKDHQMGTAAVGREMVAQWLPVGRRFISISGKVNIGSPTVQMYLTPLNCTFKNTIVEFI